MFLISSSCAGILLCYSLGQLYSFEHWWYTVSLANTVIAFKHHILSWLCRVPAWPLRQLNSYSTRILTVAPSAETGWVMCTTTFEPTIFGSKSRKLDLWNQVQGNEFVIKLVPDKKWRALCQSDYFSIQNLFACKLATTFQQSGYLEQTSMSVPLCPPGMYRLLG